MNYANTMMIVYILCLLYISALYGVNMAEIAGKVCTSCGKNTNDYTEFKCPRCGKTTIIRCRECRENFHTYKCSECGFEGP